MSYPQGERLLRVRLFCNYIYEGVWNLKGKARENNTPKS